MFERGRKADSRRRGRIHEGGRLSLVARRGLPDLWPSLWASLIEGKGACNNYKSQIMHHPMFIRCHTIWILHQRSKITGNFVHFGSARDASVRVHIPNAMPHQALRFVQNRHSLIPCPPGRQYTRSRWPHLRTPCDV